MTYSGQIKILENKMFPFVHFCQKLLNPEFWILGENLPNFKEYWLIWRKSLLAFLFS